MLTVEVIAAARAAAKSAGIQIRPICYSGKEYFAACPTCGQWLVPGENVFAFNPTYGADKEIKSLEALIHQSC